MCHELFLNFNFMKLQIKIKNKNVFKSENKRQRGFRLGNKINQSQRRSTSFSKF